MPTYSHSRISTFEQCPLRFKFCYIDQLETEIEETVEAFLGSRVHEALEKLYKDLKFQKLDAKEELLQFYNDSWQKNWNEAILIVRDGLDAENYRKMGERYISDYYEHYKPFDQQKTIALETQELIELTPGIKVHVRIDRLSADGPDFEIHDYKTSNTLPTQEDCDSDRQLAIYAIGVRQMYPQAKRIRLVWHYLAFNQEMASSRTDEELVEVREDLLQSIKTIESCSEFPAKESKLCEWCEYQPHCPRFIHLHRTQEMEPNEFLKETGVSLVNQYVKLEEEHKLTGEKLERIKEALLDYAKKEGYDTVYGSDIKAKVLSYPRLGFPKKDDITRNAFVETIRKLGLMDRLSTIDVYELAKIMNKKELPDELLALLEPFAEKGKTIRIYLSKK